MSVANKKTSGNPHRWKKGESGNPKGAPKRGESWAEIIKKYSDMTPVEIADTAKTIAGRLRSMGGGITMKEAVVIRVFAALMFEPTQGLWTSLMERTDGKVPQAVEVGNKDNQPLKVIIEYATNSQNTTPSPAPSSATDQE